MERLLNLDRNTVGFAGLKDKHARTTQVFSVPVAHPNTLTDVAAADQAVVERIQAELPVEIHWARRHGNKLKPGHLLGNRFQITVTNLSVPLTEAKMRTEAIATLLCTQGVPNFFGAQRFGINGANVEKGLSLIRNKRRERNPWLRKFLISAYQSYLCNLYLARRVETGIFDRLLLGDVAKKHDTGGMFDVTDLEVEQPRYAAQEISFTAPLFGAKMWAAKEDAGALESALQAEADIDADDWRKAKVDGTRRFGRILLPDLTIRTKQIPVGALDSAGSGATTGNDATIDALEFTFSLPKGAFATVILREFMKVDLADADIDSDVDL
ncbi:MAG: tRNA pseudouridine(13) synthase TruD [Caldilineaceae bacterium]